MLLGRNTTTSSIPSIDKDWLGQNIMLLGQNTTSDRCSWIKTPRPRGVVGSKTPRPTGVVGLKHHDHEVLLGQNTTATGVLGLKHHDQEVLLGQNTTSDRC